MTDVLEDADVLIVIGSSLGEVTSNYFTFEPRGRIIQIDAEPRSSNPTGQVWVSVPTPARPLPRWTQPCTRQVRATGLVHGMARRRKTSSKSPWPRSEARLESQDLAKELKFMADIREAVPADMQTSGT